jgi:Na+-driven multidrug efflux pump
VNTSISFKKIHKLTIPALIARIAEPLLSLTDAAIERTSSIRYFL